MHGSGIISEKYGVNAKRRHFTVRFCIRITKKSNGKSVALFIFKNCINLQELH
ncbi:MAG: hypothetical protein IJF08_02940 [Clostridia bacterium]|nr:hypothetical protein [Clostridia bacterium]